MPPQGKGVMGAWARLASRAAFRKGQARYYRYTNDVLPGTWSGGMVGLKSILGAKNRRQALDTLNTLKDLGYVRYDFDPQSKKLTYLITDWVVKCSGAECMDGAVYATEGYGFLCLPRSITQRLAEQSVVFGEADAWLDLWCHTVWQEPNNAFSFLAPAVQFGRYGAALTLETLGHRWRWEKTKVWRFLKKHEDAFTLHKLPGAFGCLIFNTQYPTCTESSCPSCEDIERISSEIRILGRNTHSAGTDNQRFCRMIAWYSKRLCVPTCADSSLSEEPACRVALFAPLTRAYFSLCRNCKNDDYDCEGCQIEPAVGRLEGGRKYEHIEYG